MLFAEDIVLVDGHDIINIRLKVKTNSKVQRVQIEWNKEGIFGVQI